MEGSVIKTEDRWNEAYYGKAVSPVDIIVKLSVSNPGLKALRESVAKVAAGKQKMTIGGPEDNKMMHQEKRVF